MGKAKENEEEKLFAFRAVFGLGRDGQIRTAAFVAVSRRKVNQLNYK